LRAGVASPLCAACRAAIVEVPAGLGCARCGGAGGRPGVACARCRTHPPAFTTARALGPYVGGFPGNVLSRTVQHLKYHGERGLAGPLADLLAEHYPHAGDVLVVPVPLHRSRLRARGYNQALLLARGLARRRHLAVAPRMLERVRATAEHATLGATARRANVRGAFRVRPGCTLTHGTVVLVDDVFTTGATADACAQALRAAGAGAVHVYTVGRTP
jgi:ComF family protein